MFVRRTIYNKNLLKGSICSNQRNHPVYASTVDTKEVDHFTNLKSTWWEEDGPLSPLHRYNRIRVPFICESVTSQNSQQRTPSRSLKDLTILDVGCGAGVLSEALARMGFKQVVGIDAAEDVIEVAKEHALLDPNLQRNLSYAFGTIEEFSEDHKEHFDAVVTSEVIEHVGDVESFVGGCVKCLKPGGSLIVTTINQTLWARLYAIHVLESVGRIPRGTHSYDKLISPSFLQRILEKNSCKTVRLQGTFYNFVKNQWSFSNSKTFYALHAIKN